MGSSTRNVKLGVCNASFRGIDLGLTQGGCEATVTSETRKTQVDQYGTSTIKEKITGREAKVTVPMAETTLENLVSIMPGASLVTTGGSAATGSMTIATNPTANQTVVVNGKTFTFKAAVADDGDVLIGASATASATNLAAALSASSDPRVSYAQYSAAAAVVSITYGPKSIFGAGGMKGVEGNSFTLASGTAGASVTVSGATLTGGAEPTSKYVSVTNGIGVDLLAAAGELRLHPSELPLTDKSEDFVLPLANTPGAITFAYKLDAERIYNVEFVGYPDPVTKELFRIGK